MMNGRALLTLLRQHGGVVEYETRPVRDRRGRRGFLNRYCCADGFTYTPPEAAEAEAVALVRSGEEPAPVPPDVVE